MEFSGLQVTSVAPSKNPELAFAVYQEGVRIVEAGVDIFLPNNAKTSKRIMKKADADAQLGTFYKGGRIQKLNTTDYEINGRTVNTITLAVLAGEDAVALANAALKQNDATVKGSTPKVAAS